MIKKVKRILFSPLLLYLRLAARGKIHFIHPQIIGVTGSVGKTSFVHILDGVVRDKFKTRTTFKANSETGLPLGILGLRDKLTGFGLFSWIKILFFIPSAVFDKKNTFDLLIAEMAIDSPFPPQNMEYLLKIVKPQIGILLNVAPVHTEQFSALFSGKDKTNTEKLVSAIACEKGKLVTTLGATGTAIINSDNPHIAHLIADIRAKTVTFGKNEKADFRLIDYACNLQGTAFTFMHKKQQYRLVLKETLLFEEYGLICAAVIAASVELGIKLSAALDRIEKTFSMPPGRLTLLSGIKNSRLIDSSYNSSLESLTATLKLMNPLSVKGKKIAVLGDMRELGSLAEREHRAVAHQLIGICDEIVLIGPLMKQYTFDELIKLNFPQEHIQIFKTAEGVGTIISAMLGEGDLVLIKGSQNTLYLETIVKDLMADPSASGKLLCRQSASWDIIRQKYFHKNPQERYL